MRSQISEKVTKQIAGCGSLAPNGEGRRRAERRRAAEFYRGRLNTTGRLGQMAAIKYRVQNTSQLTFEEALFNELPEPTGLAGGSIPIFARRACAGRRVSSVRPNPNHNTRRCREHIRGLFGREGPGTLCRYDRTRTSNPGDFT